MAASSSTESPLGFRHPPRYQRWLDQARAAYSPPPPSRDGNVNPAPFVTWLCDSIGGLVYQVLAEVDRLRISMPGKYPAGYADPGRDYCINHCLDYDLWSIYEGVGAKEGTGVMAAKEIYVFSPTGDHRKTYETRALMRAIPGENISCTLHVCFDFQAAIADLAHELNPWGGPFLTPGCKPTREPIDMKDIRSMSPTPYGGPPAKYWNGPEPFGDESMLWARIRHGNPSVLKDLVFGTKKAKKGGARLELATPKKDKSHRQRSRLALTFKNGDPLNYRLILVLPSARHQRLFAVGRIQRWWRQVRQRLARQEMLERILAEIYAPGGAAASLAAQSFAAGASRQ